LTFPILCDLIEDSVMTISDDEMSRAMKLVAERMKLVIETAAGASVAAALFQTDQLLKNWPDLKKIGVILCGGNVDLKNYP
jgi:threonine dehydratase